MIRRVKRIVITALVVAALVGLGYGTRVAGLSTYATFVLLAAILLPLAALAAYFLSPAVPRRVKREEPKRLEPHFTPSAKTDDASRWQPRGAMTHAHR